MPAAFMYSIPQFPHILVIDMSVFFTCLIGLYWMSVVCFKISTKLFVPPKLSNFEKILI